MKRFIVCTLFLGAMTLSAGLAQAQFLNDDILIGRNTEDDPGGMLATDSVTLLRSGAISSTNYSQQFISNVDFDNTGGINNNAAGNLVMIERGSIDGAVYIGATDGSGTQTLVGDFLGGFPGFNSIVGSADLFEQVAVSPDNTKIAITGAGTFDVDNEATPELGSVFLFDYDPSQLGIDNTAVLTNGRALDNAWFAFGNHEVEWMDNDTLLLMDGDAAFVDTIDLDGSGNFDVGTRTRRRELLGPNGGVQPLDGDSGPVAYNPDISPYVFIGEGDFAGGTASNYIWVLDPTQTETNGDWLQVARARYDTAFQIETSPGTFTTDTIRDMELLSNGNLAVVMFGGSMYELDMSTLDGSTCGDPSDFDSPDGGCGGLVDDTGATLIVDGDIVYANSVSGDFTYMTIARTATTVDVDLDDDNDVDGSDFLLIQQSDPSLIPDWQAEYGSGTLLAVGTAVPEPSTLILCFGFGFTCLGRRRN